MKNPLDRYRDWALITGATSGIGEEFCHQLAHNNFNLVLLARREERLINLKNLLEKKYKIKAVTITADLSLNNFMYRVINQTELLEISLLINNAGFAITGGFLENNLDDELAMFNVNCRAPLMLSHYFGNKMVQLGRGGIINVSSITAFLAMPNRTNYSAAKAHNLLFSQGLYYELKDKGIDVLTLCPGSTRTEFAEISGIRRSGMSPTKVVNAALQNIGKKPIIIVGLHNKIVVFITRFLPYSLLITIGAKIIKTLRSKALKIK